MKRQVIISYDQLYECDLLFDTEVFNQQMVKGCLAFFSWDYDVDADPYIEYSKKLAKRCFGLSLVYSGSYIKNNFDDVEGWPPLDGTYGVTLVSLDDFVLDEECLEALVLKED